MAKRDEMYALVTLPGQGKVLEVSPIRINPIDSRLLMGLLRKSPVTRYPSNVAFLVELGMLEQEERNDEAEIVEKLDKAWQDAATAVLRKDSVLLSDATSRIEMLGVDEESGMHPYKLTVLGQEVARSIQEKMVDQFKKGSNKPNDDTKTK